MRMYWQSRARELLGVAAIIVVQQLSSATGVSAQHTVCGLNIVLRIGGDDVRGNTTIKVSAGGQSFAVPGGIPGNTTAPRSGRFETCIPESALVNGIELTSISNPSWPETTDNWNMDGVAFIDADTGRLYYRTLATPGSYRFRFTGSGPTWKTAPIVTNDKPFMNRNYSQCSLDQAYVKFVDPLNPARPALTVTANRPGSTTRAPAPFWPEYGDWGGRFGSLGITNSASVTLEFRARAADGREGIGTLYPGCSPVGL